jgi:hypothetical protein
VTIPGFSAEASEYRSSEAYRLQAPAVAPARTLIWAQQGIGPPQPGGVFCLPCLPGPPDFTICCSWSPPFPSPPSPFPPLPTCFVRPCP